jgi:hypothetical protein
MMIEILEEQNGLVYGALVYASMELKDMSEKDESFINRAINEAQDMIDIKRALAEFAYAYIEQGPLVRVSESLFTNALDALEIVNPHKRQEDD